MKTKLIGHRECTKTISYHSANGLYKEPYTQGEIYDVYKQGNEEYMVNNYGLDTTYCPISKELLNNNFTPIKYII